MWYISGTIIQCTNAMFLTLRGRLYRSLHDPSERDSFSVGLNFFLAMVVVLNIAELVYLSLPSVSEEFIIFGRYSAMAFVAIFAFEYFLRVWSAADSKKAGSVWSRRWDYIRSPMGWIDLLSFAPSLVLLVAPSFIVVELRMLKLISIVRLLKLTRYSKSLSMLARLYHDNKATLIAAAMVMLLISFMAAAGIYYFERQAQPAVFGSIPACMWWALVTLTTVGYGDMAPVTIGGRMFGTLVMISGVGVAAMPAGIFASSFVQLMREQERQRRGKQKSQTSLEKGPAGIGLNNETSPTEESLSRSEMREVDFLMAEYRLNMEQAIAVVAHFRH